MKSEQAGRAPSLGDSLQPHVTGEGSPVVLVHGLGSSSRTWDLVLPRLATAHRVITLDLPAHGDSHQGGPFDFATLRGLLLDLFDRMELERPAVVGHSWGASVALDLAAQAPDRLSRLVLVDGGYMDFRHVLGLSWEEVVGHLAPPVIDLPQDRYVQLAREGFGTNWRPEFAEIVLAHMRVQNGQVTPTLPMESHLTILRHMWEQDSLALYARLQVPTLMVVAGLSGPGTLDWDAMKALALPRIAEVAPQVEIVHMDATVHDIPMHRPAELTQLIQEFLA